MILAEQRTDKRYATGTEDDWFNLSAELGTNDQHSLALEACLHGLAQQAGRPFVNPDNSFDWPEGVPPNRDLVAHALQFAASTGSPFLRPLLELAGYNAEKGTGGIDWNWRNYSFTMSALDAAGRTAEAIKLGENYLANGGDDEKVLVKLAQILDGVGRRKDASEKIDTFLKQHSNASTAQLVTLLLDWDDGSDPERPFKLVDRGLKSLAREQPTANTANLYMMRALAHDRAAHDPQRSDRCGHIQSALKDYATTMTLGMTGVRATTIRQRRVVLERLAADLGCKDAVEAVDRPGDDAHQAMAALARLAEMLENGRRDAALIEGVNRLLDDAEHELADAMRRMIRQAADDDDLSKELRQNAGFVKVNLKL